MTNNQEVSPYVHEYWGHMQAVPFTHEHGGVITDMNSGQVVEHPATMLPKTEVDEAREVQAAVSAARAGVARAFGVEV